MSAQGRLESSIGRWQTEMPAELAKRFSDELGDELKALGFDVPGPRPSPRQPVADATRASRQKPPPRPDAAVEVVGNGQRKPGEATHEDVARLRAALQSAAIEKARLQRGLRETEHWLRQLEHSRSWRVTRPFRDAGAAFRKLSLRRAAPPGVDRLVRGGGWQPVGACRVSGGERGPASAGGGAKGCRARSAAPGPWSASGAAGRRPSAGSATPRAARTGRPSAFASRLGACRP